MQQDSAHDILIEHLDFSLSSGIGAEVAPPVPTPHFHIY